MTKPKRVVKHWTESDGDNTYALDWPIDENSIVMEIGGYEGRWASQVAEKYNPRMFIFEPQEWAYQKIVDKLPNANIYNYALWTHQTKMPLGDFGRDGGSLIRPFHQDVEMVETRDIFSYFNDQFHKDEEIDVCLMNIEGGEFVLLPYMIGLGMMKRIKYFWMQTHYFAPLAWEKMAILDEMMLGTHDIMWDFRPAATCWKRKDLK